MTFTELNLNDKLLDGIKKAGFIECMEVQARTLPLALAQKDVSVQSQTGTGKTAAFLIAIYDLLIKQKLKTQRALIIVPTRELAVQIEQEAKILGSFLDINCGSFYGGVGYKEQEQLLRDKTEILIGAPGRLMDLERSRKVNFGDTSVLVIDEADRMFDMGFIPDLRKMLRKMPPRNKRLTMLFSATLTTRVWQLAWEHMNNPERIVINPEQLTVKEITQELYHVSKSEKVRLLLGLLDRDKPSNALIFTNTKIGAIELSQRLSHNGYDCQFIIGDLPQKRRIHTIELLKEGKLKYLVATDVAARGLHINDLDLVVNYDLPEDPESYVHRIGRTARAGQKGKSIALACERFVYGLEPIENLIGMKIPICWADERLFKKDESEGMHFGKHRYGRSPTPIQSRQQHHRRRPLPKKPQPPERKVEENPQIHRDTGIDDRLEYYKKKYGESFQKSEHPKKKS